MAFVGFVDDACSALAFAPRSGLLVENSRFANIYRLREFSSKHPLKLLTNYFGEIVSKIVLYITENMSFFQYLSNKCFEHLKFPSKKAKYCNIIELI